MCVDISYQVKALEIAQISFEEAAITDTQSAWCCMRSQASRVYLLGTDC